MSGINQSILPVPKFSGEYRISIRPESAWENEKTKNAIFESELSLKSVQIPESALNQTDTFFNNKREITCYIGLDGNEVYVKTPLSQEDKITESKLISELFDQCRFSNEVTSLVMSGILTQTKTTMGIINGIPELEFLNPNILKHEGNDLKTSIKNHMNHPSDQFNPIDLLKYHPKINTLEKEHLAELMITAVKKKQPEVMKFLNQEKKVPYTVRDKEGYNLIAHAVRTEDIDLIKFLKRQGLNLADTKNNQKESALFLAAMRKNTDILKYLLEAGLDVNTSNKYKNTPLHVAIYHNQMDNVKLLLKHRADLTSINSENWTVAHFAVESGNLDMVKLMVEKGVTDFSSKNIGGHTPFYYAIELAETDIINYLLDEKIVTDIHNDPMLAFYAVGSESVKLMEMLHQKGVKFDIKGPGGDTPVHMASRTFNPDVLLFLRKIGVDFKVRNVADIDPAGERGLTFAELNEWLDQYERLHAPKSGK